MYLGITFALSSSVVCCAPRKQNRLGIRRGSHLLDVFCFPEQFYEKLLEALEENVAHDIFERALGKHLLKSFNPAGTMEASIIFLGSSFQTDLLCTIRFEHLQQAEY